MQYTALMDDIEVLAYLITVIFFYVKSKKILAEKGWIKGSLVLLFYVSVINAAMAYDDWWSPVSWMLGMFELLGL